MAKVLRRDFHSYQWSENPWPTLLCYSRVFHTVVRVLLGDSSHSTVSLVPNDHLQSFNSYGGLSGNGLPKRWINWLFYDNWLVCIEETEVRQPEILYSPRRTTSENILKKLLQCLDTSFSVSTFESPRWRSKPLDWFQSPLHTATVSSDWEKLNASERKSGPGIILLQKDYI